MRLSSGAGVKPPSPATARPHLPRSPAPLHGCLCRSGGAAAPAPEAGCTPAQLEASARVDACTCRVRGHTGTPALTKQPTTAGCAAWQRIQPALRSCTCRPEDTRPRTAHRPEQCPCTRPPPRLVCLAVGHEGLEEAEGPAGGGAPQAHGGGKLQEAGRVQHIVKVTEVDLLRWCKVAGPQRPSADCEVSLAEAAVAGQVWPLGMQTRRVPDAPHASACPPGCCVLGPTQLASQEVSR